MDWGRNCRADFNSGKTQLIWFDQSNNTGAKDVKMNVSVLEEKSNIRMLGLILSSKLNWRFSNISIGKTASETIGALIHSMKFLSPKAAWNTVVKLGVVLLVATSNSRISYKNG